MYLQIKRLLDLLASMLLLIIVTPFLVVIAVTLYFCNGKQVLFKQPRVGKNEKIFLIYKFKTMNDQKDEEGNLLPDVQRLTKFGAFLRKTSLDELPQLWNIFKGDMSFVGPRPLLIEYLPLYTKEQARRHLVIPGLTGLAQVNGRNALTWEEKFQYDVTYVDQASLKTDSFILVKTVLIVLKRKGVNSGKQETMERFMGVSK
ncbi:sugar transferase [Enterococcus villorum]|uniref:Sugar transferase n=2 Tax=Enterococcus villorum TaxID=112904 RepID=A0A511J5Q9_9ENTE|nr:sugar transferase [Enterococcus villorum]EOH92021.1 hypothetical protein UAO_00692 [Enterococcus villorum ATCC 700913]EOW76737.1 hypothetical protein I591_02045 [Enterococcus villorum ATCC 700913]GEL93053.1 sugar transferase [Enterococcus villorum]